MFRSLPPILARCDIIAKGAFQHWMQPPLSLWLKQRELSGTLTPLWVEAKE
jgi:hypothetical protein